MSYTRATDIASAGIVCHQAERVAALLVQLIDSTSDINTLHRWSRHVGVSVGALKIRCRAVQVTPKTALNFGRLLRAVVKSLELGWDLNHLLDTVDPRTLQRLFARAALGAERGRICLDEFLACQNLLRDEQTLAAVRRQLSARAIGTAPVTESARRRGIVS